MLNVNPISVCHIFTSHCIIQSYLSMGSTNSKIQAYGKTVREERDVQIRKWSHLLEKRKQDLKISEAKEKVIVMSYAHELAVMLNEGQTTSQEIFTVLAHRCTSVGFHYNHITEVDFEVAERAALKCDDQRKKTGKKNWTLKDPWDTERFLPPLFGIPTSVKDLFDQKGKRTTIGSTVRAHEIKEKDSGIVACLREGGLIPFVRSNVAQLTMTWQTHNFLYGRSLNVWNPDRSIGGSSGGEGGLISSFCSPIGIGSDIGGSLRIPAEFNGIASLRPCFQRFSTSREYCTNYPEILYGKNSIVSVFGPLARCVDDLALWMKTVCEQRFHVQPDPFHKHVQFDVKEYATHSDKKLRIGVVKSHRLLEATPASQRAVELVTRILESQGHQVVPVEIPDLDQIAEEFHVWYQAEGNFLSLSEFLQGEEEGPSYKVGKMIATSKIVRTLASCLTQILAPRLYVAVKNSKQISVADYCRHQSRVSKMRMDFCSWWKEQGLDHIITPGYGCQPNLFNLSGDLWPCCMYTFIWNLLNMPAGALPVTLSRSEEEHYESAHNDVLTRALQQNAVGSRDLPVGILVIGQPFQEERILSLMKSLEGPLNFAQYRKVPKVF